MEEGKINPLTGMRGLFAMVILLFHWGGEFAYPADTILNILYREGGNLGNAFFFMSSGFLIAYRHLEKLCNGKEEKLVFLKRRILSIYPIYFLSEITSVVLNACTYGIKSITFQDILFDLLMIRTGWVYDEFPNTVVGWFVCILLICYMLFCIIALIVEKTRTNPAYFAIVLSVFGLCIQNHPLDLPFLYGHNGTGIFNFFVGVTLAIALNESSKRREKICGALLLLFCCVWVYMVYILKYPEWMGRSHIVYTLWLFPLVFATMNTLPVRFLGKIFYPLGLLSKYIIFLHMPIYYVMRMILPSNYILIGPTMTFLVFLTALVLTSFVLYILEKWVKRKNVLLRGIK